MQRKSKPAHNRKAIRTQKTYIVMASCTLGQMAALLLPKSPGDLCTQQDKPAQGCGKRCMQMKLSVLRRWAHLATCRHNQTIVHRAAWGLQCADSSQCADLAHHSPSQLPAGRLILPQACHYGCCHTIRRQLQLAEAVVAAAALDNGTWAWNCCAAASIYTAGAAIEVIEVLCQGG